jgi:hypothetical protein
MHQAGLGEYCVPHGLRKAACRIMAENNCTTHEIKIGQRSPHAERGRAMRLAL